MPLFILMFISIALSRFLRGRAIYYFTIPKPAYTASLY